MSKENSSVPVNLYGILDQELQRMHEMFKVYLTLPKDPQPYGHYSSNSTNHNSLPIMYNRIVEIQDILLKALIAHDVVLQEKIAELALTGVAKDETRL